MSNLSDRIRRNSFDGYVLIPQPMPEGVSADHIFNDQYHQLRFGQDGSYTIIPAVDSPNTGEVPVYNAATNRWGAAPLAQIKVSEGDFFIEDWVAGETFSTYTIQHNMGSQLFNMTVFDVTSGVPTQTTVAVQAPDNNTIFLTVSNNSTFNGQYFISFVDLSGSVGTVGAQGARGPAGPQGPTIWSGMTGTPTTLEGYGITDAVNADLVGAINGVASLDSTGKIPTSELPEAVLGGLNFQGTWNASINSPSLASGVGTKGYFYKVSVGGGTLIDGVSTWNAGDMIAFNGTVWDKIDGVATEVTSVAGMTGNVTLNVTDVTNAASVNSPAFFGTPTAPTAPLGTQTTVLATCEFVQDTIMATAGGTAPVQSVAGKTGAVTLVVADVSGAAPIAAPTFTGTVTAPTPTTADNSTKVATTAYVQAQGYLTAATFSGSAATSTPIMDGTGTVGTSGLYARQDHIHPTDSSRAPLASPVLTGVPKSVTPATADNSTAIATTAYVQAQGYLTSATAPNAGSATPLMDGTAAVGVSALYARQDHVHGSDTSKASLSSAPTFTGAVTAPSFNGSGAGLNLGTVTDSYTIQNLGTVTTSQALSPSAGRYIRLTLGANITVTLGNGASATSTEKVIVEISQDATGSRTIYWQSQHGYLAGITPTLSTTAGAVDIIEYTWNGMYWMVTNFNPGFVTASTMVYGLRPSSTTNTWTTTTNPTNAYDTGTTPSVDSSTYATYYAPQGGAAVTYMGFSGLTKTGTLYINASSTAVYGTLYVQYSINGGSTWNILKSVTGGSPLSGGPFTVGLTNPNLANLQVQVWASLLSGSPCTVTVYDVVFI